MARVTGPLHSDSASGAVGQAVVYGNWKGQYWTRAWVKPGDPGTKPQSNMRGRLAAAVHAWQTLSQTQRDSYDACALQYPNLDPVTGLSSPWSGFNLFCHVAVFLQLTNQADWIRTSPPNTGYASLPDVCYPISIAAAPNGFTITWTCKYPAPPDRFQVLIYAEANFGPGEKPSAKKAHYCQDKDAENGGPHLLDWWVPGTRLAVWARLQGHTYLPDPIRGLVGMFYYLGQVVATAPP